MPESSGSGTGGDQHNAVLSPDSAAAVRLGHCEGGESRDAAAAEGISKTGRRARAAAESEGESRAGVWNEAGRIVAVGGIGVGPVADDRGGRRIPMVRNR